MFDYPSMRVPAAGGGLVATARPALWVRTRPHDHAPWATGTVEVYAFGMIDSGAFVTAVPMWMLDKLGIAAGERTEVSAYGASGQLRAYKTMIGMEISHGGAGRIWAPSMSSRPIRSGRATLNRTTRFF